MSVPSFSSFQPSTPSVAEERRGPQKTSKKKHRSKASRHVQETSQLSRKEDPPRLWMEDLRGDVLNAEYGGLYARSIPKYRLSSQRNLVGLKRDLFCHRNQDHAVEISTGHHSRTSVNSSHGLLIPRPVKHYLYPSRDRLHKRAGDEEIDYIPIRTRSRTHENSAIITLEAGVSPSNSSDDEQTNVSSNYQLESREPKPSAGGDAIIGAERKLSVDPTSVKDWFTLVQFSIRTVPHDAKNSFSVKADIATSVLRRALQSHPRNRQSVSILTRYLAFGEEIWPLATLELEWETALKSAEDDTLWMEWLDWRIRLAKRHGLDRVVDDCDRCLQVLRREESRLTAFWRIITMFHEAGYREKSMAMLQAQCELTFFTPKEFQQKAFCERVDLLEVFWDSESPRVGEPGSRGWSHWHAFGQTTGGGDIPSLVRAGRNLLSSMHDPYRRWMIDEQISERLLPLRMPEGELNDDVYGTILFGDICRFLLEISSHKGRVNLKRILLSHSGLAFPGLISQVWGQSGDFQGQWERSDFRKNAVIGELFPTASKTVDVDDTHMAFTTVGETSVPIFGPVKDWGYGALGTLDICGIDLRGQGRFWEPRDTTGTDVPFIRSVFEQLADPDDLEWERQRLLFENAIDSRRAIKYSRSQLANNKHSLPRWHWHAQLEASRGETAAARAIYENVLSEPNSNDKYRQTLWCSYAYIAWIDGLPDLALSVICRATGLDRENHSGMDILRAKQSLDEQLSAEEDSGSYTRSTVNLRALLQLLTTSIEEALRVFDEHMDRVFDYSKSLSEQVFCDCLMLLRLHTAILKNTCPKSLMRAWVTRAVSRFPNNTFILGCFIEVESGESIWGRVSNLIGENIAARTQDRLSSGDSTTTKSLGRRLWETWVILAWMNKDRLYLDKYRARRLLSSHMEEPCARHNPTLWRVSIELEIRVDELHRAKDLLVIAISRCPLSKELYLLAFGPLRSVFTAFELNGLMDAMVERGIRVRRDLEPYLADWKESDSELRPQGVADEEEFPDDVEMGAEEYRRLLPY